MFISEFRNRMELFYKYSGVPAFVIDKNDKLVYSTFGAKKGDQLPIIDVLKAITTCSDCPRLVVYNGIELYGIINQELRGSATRLIVGPVLSIKPSAAKNLKLLSFSAHFPEDTIRRYVKNIQLMSLTKFVHFLELVYHSLTNRLCRFDEIADKKVVLEMIPDSLAMNIPETVFAGGLANIEPYIQDMMKSYELVRTGKISELELLLETSLLTRNVISQSSKENYTMFVAATAYYGKAALDSGLDFKDVETIGMAFIKYAEAIGSAEDFYALVHRMIIGYATRVYEDSLRKQHPQAVEKAVAYVEKNLHYPLTLEDVAKHVNLSRAYFSQLFSRVMGISLQSYINKRKTQEAEQHLKYTSMSIKEISDLLAFCSQSYFTEVFKSVTGTTPIAYRKRAKEDR